jgi:hypothetical protein
MEYLIQTHMAAAVIKTQGLSRRKPFVNIGGTSDIESDGGGVLPVRLFPIYYISSNGQHCGRMKISLQHVRFCKSVVPHFWLSPSPSSLSPASRRRKMCAGRL